MTTGQHATTRRGRPAGQQSCPPPKLFDSLYARYDAEQADQVEGMDWLALFVGGSVDAPPRDEVFTGSTDGHGHSATVRVSVPPHTLGFIEEFIASRSDPRYRSVGDFVRDAITHRLWELAMGQVGPTERSRDLHKKQMIEETMRKHIEWVEAGDASVRNAREMLERMKGTPQWEKVVGEVEGYALGLQEPWRGEILALIAHVRGDG